MKTRTFLTVLAAQCMLFASLVHAQEEVKQKPKYETEIFGYLVDDRTQQPVFNAKVTVTSAQDTTLEIPVRLASGDQNNQPRSWIIFTLHEPGEYIIKCEAEGYETTVNHYTVAKLYKHEHRIWVNKPWYIRKLKETKKDIQLSEAVVKATKIKFYIKGDTMVYNADAFELAEGSMLDALIKQLPGVELKEGGDILVNGRHVDELLLNGRDFLNSDRKIVLDNLPSYMVKNIKVFERKDMLREVQGDTLTRKLAMDVRLKKEYSIGLVGNAEAGMGTDHRFLARLFGLRFAPNSSLLLFANTNNLSDNREPGNQGDWSPLMQATGLTTLYNGGVKYEYGKNNMRYRGDLKASHADGKNRSYTNRENFLSSGNTFGRSFDNSNSHNTTLSTSHRFYTGQGINLGLVKISYLRLAPSLQYNHFSSNSDAGSATADDDIFGTYGKAWRDSITTPNAGQLMRTHGLNRVISSNKGSGHNLNTEAEVSAGIDIAHHDALGLFATDQIKFKDSDSRLYDHYNLQYIQDGNDDFRNRHNRNKTQNFENRVSVQNNQIFLMKGHVDVHLRYEHTYTRETQTRSLYLLNKLSGWGRDTEHELGELPSVDEMLLALDNGNSYRQREDVYMHDIRLNFRAYNYRDGDKHKQKLTAQFKYEPTVSFRSDRLHYERGTLDTLLSRHYTTFGQDIDLCVWPNDKGFPWPWYVGIQYNLSTRIHDLSYLVDYRDDSNPLNIMLGNPHIRNAHNHHIRLYLRSTMKKQRQLNADITANINRHRLAMGYTYDTQTGVRTVMPDNINGNWDITGQLNYSARFDKDGRFTYSANTEAIYINSVDMIEQLRSEVHTTNINETLKLNARFSAKASLNVKADLHWQHSTSGRENFSTINVADFDYGLGGVFQIPFGFQFSTDMTMYSRRGYNDHSMNTNELVWNARLSRHFAKAGLTVMLDAFDLFGQLSNVRRTINAQGRTETWSNVTPQYAMLHVLYRLNKKPKK